MSNATQYSGANKLNLIPLWNSARVRELIENSTIPGGPAILQLGRQEKQALLLHLKKAFGKRIEFDNHSLHYMGLRVQEIDAQNFMAVTGSRRAVQRPRTDDVIEASSRWQFRLG